MNPDVHDELMTLIDARGIFDKHRASLLYCLPMFEGYVEYALREQKEKIIAIMRILLEKRLGQPSTAVIIINLREHIEEEMGVQ